MIDGIRKGDTLDFLVAHRYGYEHVLGAATHANDDEVVVRVHRPARLSTLTLAPDTCWDTGCLVAYRGRTSVREGFVPRLCVVRIDVRQESSYRAMTDGGG